MALIDVMLLLVITAFTLFGFWFGFIHTLGSATGFFAGIFLASRFFDYWGGSVSFKIFLFVLIFILVGRLIGLAFYFVNKAFHLIKIIPFTSLLNRLLGATFGFIEGMLVVTGVVFIINFYSLDAWLGFVKRSEIVPYALKLSKLLMPFVTKAFSVVQNYI